MEKHYDEAAKLKDEIKKAQEEIRVATLDKAHNHEIVYKIAGEYIEYPNIRVAQDVRKYSKIWLLNATDTNKNGWGVHYSTLDQNIRKFIGRPYVVTSKDFFPDSPYGSKTVHPVLPTDNLNSLLEYQDKFRVGTIVDVIKEGNDYYAMIDIKPKFTNQTLPPFCSPGVYQIDHEPENKMKDWEALHLAGLIEKPAYGINIAQLKGTCVGTQKECKLRFSENGSKVLCTDLQMAEKIDSIKELLSALKYK